MDDLQQNTIPDDTMTVYTHLSIKGRLAYLLMCIEAYLVNVYPDRDWRLLTRGLWLFSSMPLLVWLLLYEELIPDTALHRNEETRKKFYSRVQKYFTWDEYQSILQQYNGIANGNPDDPNDVLSAVLRIPFDLIAQMDDSEAELLFINIEQEIENVLDDSIRLLGKLEHILSASHIKLPDIHKLDFMAIKDGDKFGPHFDGPSLSIILPKEDG